MTAHELERAMPRASSLVIDSGCPAAPKPSHLDFVIVLVGRCCPSRDAYILQQQD
jgi:hypothetical protein